MKFVTKIKLKYIKHTGLIPIKEHELHFKYDWNIDYIYKKIRGFKKGATKCSNLK